MFEDEEAFDVVQSMSLTRSLISYGSEIILSPNHRLVRIYEAPKPSMIDEESITCHSKLELNSSIHLLWDLQTCGHDKGFNEPLDIWTLPQLRHVLVTEYLYVQAPLWNGQDHIVLENLQTLVRVKNFKCSEEVVKRIPNIKVLHFEYNDYEEESCLNNLERFHKLKEFYCESVLHRDPYGTDFMLRLSFPHSLKKIFLIFNHVHLEDMFKKIGSLPFLRSFYLHGGFFRTHAWETVEGQFPNLKLLEIEYCAGLKYWNSESSHFPRLERLVLRGIKELNEIPLGIGEIPTLHSIKLLYCSNSAVISCKRMQEERG